MSRESNKRIHHLASNQLPPSDHTITCQISQICMHLYICICISSCIWICLCIRYIFMYLYIAWTNILKTGLSWLKSDGKNSFEVKIKFKTSQRWPIIRSYSHLTCSQNAEFIFNSYQKKTVNSLKAIINEIKPSKMEVASQHCETLTNKTKDILDHCKDWKIYWTC